MSFLEEGKKTELEFAKTLKDFSLATKEQDIYEHWDIISDGIKYDVKGLKKIRRYDSKPDENVHWIEINNVNGDPGWLYGKADYFVFETFDYWIIVDKIILKDFIETKTIQIQTSYPELYHLYRRLDKRDIITLVKTIDLMKLSHKIIDKI